MMGPVFTVLLLNTVNSDTTNRKENIIQHVLQYVVSKNKSKIALGYLHNPSSRSHMSEHQCQKRIHLF